MGKPYMPLMIGDWLKGTRGMKAEVRGVYLGLLLHQYEHGFIPADIESLALIEPEVGKVWVSLKSKFKEIEEGKLQNRKCEVVKEFWDKQGKNGKKGGRPKKSKPKQNPKHNPNGNPNHNLHNDHDYDYDNDIKEGGVGEEKNDDEKLQQYDDWGEMIIQGKDQFFEMELFKAKIDPAEITQDRLTLYLGLLNTYPKKRPTSQQSFRKSLLAFIIEEKQKNKNGNNSSKNNGKRIGRATESGIADFIAEFERRHS